MLYRDIGVCVDRNIVNLLEKVLASRQLKTTFQPVVDLEEKEVIGHQAVVQIQGQSEVFSPVRLLGLALRSGQAYELAALYRRLSIERYAPHHTGKSLFFHASPFMPDDLEAYRDDFYGLAEKHDFDLSRLTAVLRCRKPELNQSVLAQVVTFYRSLGVRVALQVNGQTLDSHMFWGGVLPDFLKLEPSLIQGVDDSPENQRRVSTALELCQQYGVTLIAEGINTYLEYDTLLRLGVPCGQGDFLARRSREPVTSIATQDVQTLVDLKSPFEADSRTLGSLIDDRRTLVPSLPVADAVKLFVGDTGLGSIPVTDEGRLVGVLAAQRVIEYLAEHVSLLDRHLPDEEGGEAPVTVGDLLSEPALVLPAKTTLWEFSQSIQAEEQVVDKECIFLTDERGEYEGRVFLRDVFIESLDIQHQALRHANPLSGLPGHVPVDEAIIRLMKEKSLFVVASIGINELKAFNDRYGYVQGDRVILQVAKMLKEMTDPEMDFVGHIGGDNFVVVFKSGDWFERCENMINQIDVMANRFYRPEDRERGGLCTVDRRGNEVFSPFFSLCIGAVPVYPGKFSVHHEISAVAAEVKARAGATYGGAIYVDQRNYRNTEGELKVRLS